jgi:hypothetical protein
MSNILFCHGYTSKYICHNKWYKKVEIAISPILEIVGSNLFPVAGNSDFTNVQVELDVFSKWCIDSGMQLNLGKCKSMSFTRFRVTIHFQYELSGFSLNIVDSICDLGVVLDSKLNFTSHIDSLFVKASRMLGYIRRIQGSVYFENAV